MPESDSPPYRVEFDKEDQTWGVVDRDGGTVFGYDTREEAEQSAAEMNHEDAIDEARSEIDSLLIDCDDLAKLHAVLAILREGDD